MTETPARVRPPLDPQIAEFVARMNADAARHPRRDTVSIAEARRIAEEVRAPWVAGGPRMAQTDDHMVPTRHGPVRVRLYRPATLRAASGSALVYLPGGGWTLFSIDTHDRLMREYAERAGIVVVGIDYSRAPEARFPVALEEIEDVIDWLPAGAGAFGVDPARLLIGGDSAGANLAVATCLRRRDAGRPAFRGMVLNYGVYDPGSVRESGVLFGGGDLPLSSHVMLWFIWNYLPDLGRIDDPAVRVIAADLRGLPPAFMAITDQDILLDENLEMAQRLRAASVPVTERVYPGTVHSFLEAVSIADVAARALDETAGWIVAGAE